MFFDQKVQESIGCYVYALFDPRTPKIPFYIGKGSGNRVFDHVNETFVDSIESGLLSAKLELIKEIRSLGKEVTHKIIKFNLTEEEAYSIEAALIDMVNYMQPEALKNQISGHGVAEGIIDAVDLSIALSAEQLKTEEPILIIKIERLWDNLLIKHEKSNAIPVSSIFDAVKGNWKVSTKRANSAKYVFAVSRGVIRAVFTSPSWENSSETGRKSFVCGEKIDAFTSEFIGKSVTNIFKRGSQNPIRYLNC